VSTGGIAMPFTKKKEESWNYGENKSHSMWSEQIKKLLKKPGLC